MFYSQTYNIFISHAWKYSDDYGRLKMLLDHEPQFIYKDYSISEDKSITDHYVPDYIIEEKLKEQISHASVVLVLLGMYASPTYHEWISRELTMAIQLNKPIIGVSPWGQERVPQPIVDLCCSTVGWNTKSIITAIKQHC